MNAEHTSVLFVIIVRSLHDMYEMNSCIAGCVSACLSACFNWRIAGRILMKFGIQILPLGATPNLVPSSLLQPVTLKWRSHELVWCELHHRHYV
jgi:hypothetical protein